MTVVEVTVEVEDEEFFSRNFLLIFMALNLFGAEEVWAELEPS